ncbi:hypothetical protein [Stackebrandtia nassauensis]|uniref:Lipoprotein n=1 Tax=Stackebrandtia nassauensis (strain DSM 44728 / CIP 108903 / NRRL B-16338 / NBRC 102104 / LLR-40K-21) TaxID=446470 RepID=D3Q1L2_STANL|nr:hypothetical protein [Stackebrandtia nassauensis]ADD39860.1 hypothetical protein Snas_0139 [Stackebrandtia nassauensis DSM 44728]
MKSLTSRVLTLGATGALAVAIFSGCSLVQGAVDCATVGETMSKIASNVGGDEKTLKKYTKELRDEAKNIEDADLKKSAEDFADEAESVNAGLNGDLQGGAETEADKLQGSADKFLEKCNAL